MYTHLINDNKRGSALRNGRWYVHWGRHGGFELNWAILGKHCWALGSHLIFGNEGKSGIWIGVPFLFSVWIFVNASPRMRNERSTGIRICGLDGWGPMGDPSFDLWIMYGQDGGQRYFHKRDTPNVFVRWWKNWNGNETGWRLTFRPWGALLGYRKHSSVPVKSRHDEYDPRVGELRARVAAELAKWRETGVQERNWLLPYGLTREDNRVDIENVSFGFVRMPEGEYPVMIELTEDTWRYPRWPWWPLTMTMRRGNTSVLARGGIPFPGKGENSWDCGMNGTYGLGCRSESVHEAIDELQKSVLENRRRYAGNRLWVPPKEEACASS